MCKSLFSKNYYYYLYNQFHSVRQHKNTARCKTITIPSNENMTPETITMENQLRKLLRQERVNNAKLNLEYRKLQERNLNLVTSYNEVKKENQRLKSLLNDYLYDVNEENTGM